MRKVIHVVLILINIFLRITTFQHEKAFFVFRYTDFVIKWLPWLQQKYHSHTPDMSNHSSIKFYVRIRSTKGNILDCLAFNCVFIISDMTQFIILQFVKNIFRFSFVFFSSKTVQILIFKVEYLDNCLADFNDFGLILQDFELPFK